MIDNTPEPIPFDVRELQTEAELIRAELTKDGRVLTQIEVNHETK
jgi:hypothetical protein